MEELASEKNPAVVDGREDLEAEEMEEEEVENFSLSFPPPQRSQSPKHIKLKLPMSTLAGKSFSFFFLT